jgi:hypothetical protein
LKIPKSGTPDFGWSIVFAKSFGHGGSHRSFVMPALGAGIHVFCASKEDVDGRVKPGHDARVSSPQPLPRTPQHA